MKFSEMSKKEIVKFIKTNRAYKTSKLSNIVGLYENHTRAILREKKIKLKDLRMLRVYEYLRIYDFKPNDMNKKFLINILKRELDVTTKTIKDYFSYFESKWNRIKFYTKTKIKYPFFFSI